MNKFHDRQDAGLKLANKLEDYSKKPEVLVLALPRGGVPVAYEISKALSAPLDVLIVRKLGVPGHEELAFGAIASGNTLIFNEEIINSLHLSDDKIKQVIEKETNELKRRELLYRKGKPAISVKDKTIILVDDGIATGATMLAAVNSIAKQKAKNIIIATPVAALSTAEDFINKVDEFICLLQPFDFYAVGLWYDNFNQTSDEEVADLLMKANKNEYCAKKSVID